MGENEAHYLDYFYLGLCFMRTNDIENATKTLEICRSKFTQFPDVLYYLALIASRNNQISEALNFISQAQTNHDAKLRLNEDNEFYANYPAQIQIYDINKLRDKLIKK
jgi:tetratricopeptide (TPR) repeat protein